MQEQSSGRHKPLSSMKVVDFTRFLAGPYCAMLLGDMGAEVVKIEIPVEGDPLRNQGPPFHHGNGISFYSTNRNKKSLTLDLSTEKGRAIAKSLCAHADVVLENFRPDVMGRLGLGYEQIKESNPGVIYASISGYGASGPDSRQGAFDLTIQAVGGYMSITGEQDGSPIKLGTSAFDIITGMNCYSGILAALLQRKETGHGQKIETSLLESEVAFLTNAALEYLITGTVPRKWGSEHAQQAPYKAFQAADGWVVIGAGFQPLFESLATALGLPELIADERFITLEQRVINRVELYRILDAEIARHETAWLLEQLGLRKVPCAPVNDMRQVFEHRQVLERGMLKHLNHEHYGDIPQLGGAVKFSAFDVSEDWIAPPLLGQDSSDVLSRWLNFDQEQLDNLASEGVV